RPPGRDSDGTSRFRPAGHGEHPGRARRDADQEQRRAVDEGPRRLRPRVQRHRVQQADARADGGLEEQDHALRPRGLEASHSQSDKYLPNRPPLTMAATSTMTFTTSATSTTFATSTISFDPTTTDSLDCIHAPAGG